MDQNEVIEQLKEENTKLNQEVKLQKALLITLTTRVDNISRKVENIARNGGHI